MKRLLIFFVLFAVCFFSSLEVRAQSWSVWRTIPVFDGERVMPLSSFADQIVKEICGTTRPFIRLDDDVLDSLIRLQEEHAAARSAAATAEARKNFEKTDTEKDSIFNYSKDELLSGLDIGLRKDAASDAATEKSVRSGVESIDPERLEAIRKRIQLIVPSQGRYFEASELLLSWLGEPEIWNYIPIFEASETDYRIDVLGAATANKLRASLYRISAVQLQQSKAFQDQLTEIDRKRYEQGIRYVPSEKDAITERIQRAFSLFQDLTFNPSSQRPTRMIDLLQRTIDVSGGREPSFGDCKTTWDYLLEVGEESRSGDSETKRKHATTERWETILHRIMTLATAFDQTDAKGEPRRPNLGGVQRQFEKLLELIDMNFEESASFMEAAYSGQKFRRQPIGKNEKPILPLLFSDENRKENGPALKKLVLRYHYSVKTLRREIEAAYLALYDNGRSLRVLPIISEQAIGGEEASLDVQPWATLQTVLFAEDVMIRRFFDPQFNKGNRTTPVVVLSDLADEQMPLPDENGNEKKDVAPESADIPTKPSQVEAATTDKRSENELERELFEKAVDKPRTIETRAPSPNDAISWIRVYFEKLVSAYEIIGNDINWTDSGRQFTESATGLGNSLRESADQIDSARERLVESDDAIRHEMLQKTNYPSSGSTYPEYRYFRLAPFFWMWILAACSVGFVLLAMLFGRYRAKIVEPAMASGFETPIIRVNFTNSIEEYIYWTGILFLLLSVFVTFLGGVMRAWITGWAPITNMYETVVLMAFSASLFGLWYALHPLLYPVISLAWRLSTFPSVASLFSGFAAMKTAPAAGETDGRYAMRQAAADFGVPGAGHLVDSDDDPDEKERAMRTRSEIFWRSALVVPRLILMLLTFLFVIRMCYGEYAHEHGVFAAMFELLTMHDILDWLVVVTSIALIVWFVPQILLTLIVSVVLLFQPGRMAAEAGIVSRYQPEVVTEESRRRSELSGVFHGESSAGNIGQEIDDSWSVWLNAVRNEILDRKLYILIGAVVALLAGLAAYYNSSQFNPNIRPLVAVLRSNFWLTVHVIAIILSYAAASIAWGMAVVATGSAIFGRYHREDTDSGKRIVHVPLLCETISPNIHRLIRLSIFLLALGTMLGARWADYSWGRFWSWDPKEVWALITLLFFLIVLHGRIGRLYGQFGVVIGGLFGSIAVIMTWYGINFVFKAGMHAYGGGTTENATIFLGTFVVLNTLWGVAALGRYCAEVFGTEHEEPVLELQE